MAVVDEPTTELVEGLLAQVLRFDGDVTPFSSFHSLPKAAQKTRLDHEQGPGRVGQGDLVEGSQDPVGEALLSNLSSLVPSVVVSLGRRGRMARSQSAVGAGLGFDVDIPVGQPVDGVHEVQTLDELRARRVHFG